MSDDLIRRGFRPRKEEKSTSERKQWKYPCKANLEAEYTALLGEGTFPAVLLI